MGLDISQLPPKMQAQVRAKLEAEGQAKARRKRDRSQAPAHPERWRCGCGEEFGSYEAWERHTNADTRGWRERCSRGMNLSAAGGADAEHVGDQQHDEEEDQ